ncbi:30684_t:CDS:2, partial [Racocetra persica]
TKELNIIIIGITNHPGELDAAMTRSGRLEGYWEKVKEITWEEKQKCSLETGISFIDIRSALRRDDSSAADSEKYRFWLAQIREGKVEETEGHTLHATEAEARKKSEKEKFAGALESYTVECLLPDGQCLQLATSHYFGDNFCRAMEVKFQNQQNQFQYPFSTSWGTSTRAIGAIVKAHADNWGVILPFAIAPVQIAFILVQPNEELVKYYQEISGLLGDARYRCQLYNESSQINKNILQADREGCPLKIILGPEELKKQEITLVRRDNVERKITIKLEENETEKKYITAVEKYWEAISGINQESKEVLIKEKAKMANSFRQGQRAGKIFGVISKEAAELQKNLYQKSVEFRDQHIFSVSSLTELEKKIKDGNKGLFLVPFCNNLDCELKIKEKVPSYSIRCLYLNGKKNSVVKCLFCQAET